MHHFHCIVEPIVNYDDRDPENQISSENNLIFDIFIEQNVDSGLWFIMCLSVNCLHILLRIL